ncbi:MAG TPA: hypothetical protein DDY77_07100, partial [Clostridiales bacterium]|nr:hypothetical protein [Clostridiales bacterium]
PFNFQLAQRAHLSTFNLHLSTYFDFTTKRKKNQRDSRKNTQIPFFIFFAFTKPTNVDRKVTFLFCYS